jgi:hypothetical protein
VRGTGEKHDIRVRSRVSVLQTQHVHVVAYGNERVNEVWHASWRRKEDTHTHTYTHTRTHTHTHTQVTWIRGEGE